MRASQPKAATNYRLTTESTSRLTEIAQKKLLECEGCTGAPCRKAKDDNRYFQPVVTDGVWDWGRCKYYVEPIKPEKPEKPQAQPEEKPLELIGEIFKSASTAEALKQLQARQKALIPQYSTKYGVKGLTMRQMGQLQDAELRIIECEGCNGQYCNKASRKYQQPQITLNSETLEIETVLCAVWREVAGKEQCERAGVPRKYIGKTFADYEITADNKQAVSQAQWFLRAQRDCGLYIFGGAGTGKTFLASLIACESVNRGTRIVFGDVPELLNRLKATFNNQNDVETYEKTLRTYCKAELLFLDDLGAGQITEWAVGVLYQIINERYNANKPLIVTSNYDLKGLRERLSRYDDFGGTRIVSRLKEMCYQAFLGTKDRRG